MSGSDAGNAKNPAGRMPAGFLQRQIQQGEDEFGLRAVFDEQDGEQEQKELIRIV